MLKTEVDILHVGISRLFDAIGLDAVEEVVAKKEDIFITAIGNLDTILSSSL